jgi:hypothetical protein
MGASSTRPQKRLVSSIDNFLKKRIRLSDRLSQVVNSSQVSATKRSLAKILLDNEENIPRKAALKIRDVRDIVTGASLGVLVVEPQSYDKVTLLDDRNDAFHEKDSPVGYFHHETSGLAHTGDGGDYGDLWWKASPALHDFLLDWILLAEGLLKGTLTNEAKLVPELENKYAKHKKHKYASH